MLIDGHTHIVSEESPWSQYVSGPMEALLRQMDTACIEKAVVLPLEPWVSTSSVAEACKAHPDRLIGFASIHFTPENVSTGDLGDLFEKQVNDFGFRGLKLYPRMQCISLRSSLIYPLFSKAAELEMPVIVDFGTFGGSAIPLEEVMPLNIDRIAVAIPEATIIMAHMGGHRVFDAFAVARSHKKVFLDVSGLPDMFAGSSLEMDMRWVVKRCPDRVIWGSDFPDPSSTLKDKLEQWKGICEELELSKEDTDLVFGGTISKILRLS